MSANRGDPLHEEPDPRHREAPRPAAPPAHPRRAHRRPRAVLGEPPRRAAQDGSEARAAAGKGGTPAVVAARRSGLLGPRTRAAAEASGPRAAPQAARSGSSSQFRPGRPPPREREAAGAGAAGRARQGGAAAHGFRTRSAREGARLQDEEQAGHFRDHGKPGPEEEDGSVHPQRKEIPAGESGGGGVGGNQDFPSTSVTRKIGRTT